MVSVPSFQRNYAWGKDNLNQFLIDVFESVNSGEKHFYGPIVVLKDGDENYQLIDGQQRLTTAIMTLSIARDLLYDTDLFSNRKIQHGISEEDLETPFKTTLFAGGYLNKPKFKANHFLEKYFEERVLKAPHEDRKKITVRGEGLSSAEKQTTKEFRAGYLYVKQELQKFLKQIPNETDRKFKLHDLHGALTHNFQIATLELSDEDDAYELFENLNHRGVQLAPSDLLKTLTLRDIRLQGSDVFEKALDTWDDIIQVHLSGTAEFTKYLRYFLLTQINKPIQASKIYGEFKDIISSSGVGGAQRNLDNLSKSASHYSKLIGVTPHENEDLKNAFIRLNIIGQTHKVLLLRAMQSGLNEEQMLKLTRAVEMLMFRWVAAGENAQILENHFRENAHKLKIGADDEKVNEVCKALTAVAPSDSALRDLHLNGSEDVARYVLQALESKLGNKYFTWENPPTLEHLAPQKPGNNKDHWHNALNVNQAAANDDLSVDQEYTILVKQWGNLSLLEFSLNSSIKNASWLTKRDGNPPRFKGISSSGFRINAPFSDLDSWNINLVNDRGEWMRDSILRLRSSDWVKSGNAQVQEWKP